MKQSRNKVPAPKVSNPLARVDTRSSLPAGLMRPTKAQKLELLRARMAAAAEAMRAPKTKPSSELIGALASQARIGVSSRDYRISDLMRIRDSNSPHKGIARALVSIWEWQRHNRADVLVEDRRVLNALTNRLRRISRSSARPAPKLRLTEKEKKVLRGFISRTPKNAKPDIDLGD